MPDLWDEARQMGVDAAREVHMMGNHERPRLSRAPYEHARYLLKRDGTEAELIVVQEAWEDGVDEFWSHRFDDRRN